MRRCAICDYLEGYGSDFQGIGRDHRKVVWRADHQEFQCEVCTTTVRSAVIEKEMEDLVRAYEKKQRDKAAIPIDQAAFSAGGEASVDQIPFTLPQLPF